MKTSDAGFKMIKSFEGLYLETYRCPAGVATIGWGHTKGVKMGQKITEAQAQAFLEQDVVPCEKAAARYDGLYHWSQNEFDALVSFLFNLGPGKMPSFVKSGTLPKNKLADRFMEYDHAKVKGVMQKVPGLTRRRAAERALFIGGGKKQGRPVLKIGSRGEDVKDLQKLLKNAGYDVGAIDGIFGKKTDAAVRMYQNDHIDACKTVDGIVGAKTWKAIENK